MARDLPVFSTFAQTNIATLAEPLQPRSDKRTRHFAHTSQRGMCRPGRFPHVSVSASPDALKKTFRIHLSLSRQMRLNRVAAALQCVGSATGGPVPGIAMIQRRFYDLARAMATPHFDAGKLASLVGYSAERLG
jgi:hypothetical protein